MRRNSRAYCLVTAWALITALILGSCVKAPAAEGDMWAPGVTFQMTLQPLTDQEKETIRSVLAPNGEGLVFLDEIFAPEDPHRDTGFSYKNLALSDEQQEVLVESKAEALEMAKSALRSIGLLPDEEDYYVQYTGFSSQIIDMRPDEGATYVQSTESADSGTYSDVLFYYKFHNIPLLRESNPDITVSVRKDGVYAISYDNRYAIQAMDQTESAPSYISESQAIASYREKLKEKCCGPTVVADEDLCFMRVYVYTEAGEAVPMYMFGEKGEPFLNAIFVNAVSGEATDFPWGS